MKKYDTIFKNAMDRRQNENYERFVQEKADVFQVTGQKEQAMFWVAPCTISTTGTKIPTPAR